MRDWQSLSHVKWECKYHVLWVPKYRRKVLYGKVRKRVGEVIRELCRQRDLEIIEGHAMPDHIHTCISIPPKYSVANAIGFLQGKSAIRLHREFGVVGTGRHFWIRGYCVSTVGLNEEQIRRYIREQENLDKQQMELKFE
jgi:putative transposase